MIPLTPSGGDDTALLFDVYRKTGGLEKLRLGSGTFRYNGPGLSGGSYNFEGDGPGSTVVALGPNSYFFASSNRIDQLDLGGMTFIGGLGAIHFTFPGINVTNHFYVDKCRFRGYAQTAIGHNSLDMPYWKISRSIFDAANSVSTMGVALAGYTDQSTLTDCSFLRNKIHIKAGLSGNNLGIDKCDLLQFDKGTQRTMVWVVPNPSWNNAGQGFLVTGTKFGNENLDISDYRILYADELAGADFAIRLPNFTMASAGYVVGHRVRTTVIGSTGNGPFVYSMVPQGRVLDCVYDLQIAGSKPRAIVEYHT